MLSTRLFETSLIELDTAMNAMNEVDARSLRAGNAPLAEGVKKG